MAIDSLLHVTGLPVDDKQFLYEFARMVERLGFRSDHADWLLATISFESGFSPKIQNPYSKATGLIQFMPATAETLGTSIEALKGMTATQQLAYVEKYYSPWKGGLIAPSDIPLVAFYPQGIGKPDDYVLFSEGSKKYEQNRALDEDDKGFVTNADYKRQTAKRYNAAQSKSRIAVPPVGEAEPQDGGGTPTHEKSGTSPTLLIGGLFSLLLLLFRRK